eukprot:1145555-Pelagomonas_calceolata.AAC.2
MRKEEEVIDLDDGAGQAGPSRFAKRQQSSLTPYMPSAEKQAAHNKDLLCFINTCESPFRRPS